jgi:hypothetical protein
LNYFSAAAGAQIGAVADESGTKSYRMFSKQITESILSDIDEQPTIQPEKAQHSQQGATSDLISRQQALKALIYAVKNVGVLDANDIRTVFKALPSIQPEARTGKWTLGFDNKYMEKYYYCSCCGGRKYGEYEPLDYFCPNCGADMRGEKDG